MKHVEELADKFVKLSVEEVLHMKKYLKETYGLEEAQPTVVTAAAPAPVEEKEQYYAMKIITHGQNKLTLVKEYNNMTKMGLTTAKAAIEDVATPIMKNHSKDDIAATIAAWTDLSAGFTAEIVSQDTLWED